MSQLRSSAANLLDLIAGKLACLAFDVAEAIRPPQPPMPARRPGGWRCSCGSGEPACDACVYSLMRSEVWEAAE